MIKRLENKKAEYQELLSVIYRSGNLDDELYVLQKINRISELIKILNG